MSSSPVSSTQPFEWETNYDAENGTKSFALQVQDAYWRTFVVTPWCIGEFGGDMGLCRQHGAEVLKKSKYDDRHSYYENNVINKQEKDSHIQKSLRVTIGQAVSAWFSSAHSFALIGSILVGLLVFNAFGGLVPSRLASFLGVFSYRWASSRA